MAWQPFLYVINGSLSVELSAAQPDESMPDDTQSNRPLSGAQSPSNTPAGSPADAILPESHATSRR